ncbi:histidine ammonia-lyase [Actinophytocola xinjiangensis]|uniref:Histidine ammonia-lyase n=1 Tax=Actinophytocola xinjiangensis TaxID=485602 RepID=A0A7Z1B116_9PSEU|nr:aromatic amino acid ammonia-lyase [Actinophytocola xinjiangensis]OLF14185.1 histidine ammonia-lyase [Actinophytocola xinjiangensis]
MTEPGPGATMVLDGHHLTIEDVLAVARTSDTITLRVADDAVAAMVSSLELRRALVDKRIPVYGVTTGFGDSVERHVAPERAARLQRNLVLYHLNGAGPLAEDDVARATLLIRANSLARGASGVRPELVELLLRLVERGITPRIPELGSLGASGDLVPLCYVAGALIGEVEVGHRGRTRPAADALADEGLAPLSLEPKEGLALINGTSFTAAFAALACADATELAFVADLATAMACEALRGNASHFHPFVHDSKPHPGQTTSAATIRALLDGSALTTSYEDILTRTESLDGRGYVRQDERIQDKYSIRCAPHVTGVLRDTLDWAGRWVRTEINSSTDNPLFAGAAGQVHHGGNFYAGHLGQAMDSLKVAVANVADLLDRQLELVVDEKFNAGLPANLAVPHPDDHEDAGVEHGFKGMQIACSAITAEALKHSGPATVFSRSTEAHNQDKVSMGTIAARDARTVVELTRQVAAIHLLALAQAVELRGVELAAPAVRRAHELIRSVSPFVSGDRRLDGDVAAVAELIRAGTLRREVTTTVAVPAC